MLLRNMVAARRYPNLAVSLTSRSSSVKSLGSCFLATRATSVKISPMAADVVTATTTENLAAFGWFAPSSFATRTLTENETTEGYFSEHSRAQKIISEAQREGKQNNCVPHCSIKTNSYHQCPKLIVHAVATKLNY